MGDLIKKFKEVSRYRYLSIFYLILAILAFFDTNLKEHFWTFIIGSDILAGISIIINNQNKTNK